MDRPNEDGSTKRRWIDQTKMNRPICDSDTRDPWMIEHDGLFYLVCTLEYRIEIWCSASMEDFQDCQKSLVWEPTPRDEFIFNVWAPELHRLDSAWYIYFTAAPPDRGKPSHRTLVLKSTNPEPMVAASWKFLGLIRNMPDHRQIDSTVFTTVHGLFCCYSGWPPGDKSDTQQYLYLVKLRTPEGAIPESLVCISRPELPRERFEDNKRGIDTAPTFLDTSFVTGLVYSASCSWSSERKLALLYLDGDPMKTSSSRNRQTPLLVSDERPPFGPGQASFIKSSLNDMVCCIYHAQARQDDHWHRRQARVLLLAAKDFQDTADSICCAQA